MSILNSAPCGVSNGNTGIGDCSFDPKNLVGGFLVPKSFVITAANLATKELALAALAPAASADLPAQRIYPLPLTLGMTNNSETPVKFSYGYGAQVTVRDGMYIFNQAYADGSLCISNQLMKFNGNRYNWIGLDAAGFLWGTKVGNDLAGIPLNEFYNNPFTPSDGTNPTGYSYDLSLNKNYLNQDIAFISLGLAQVQAIKGLQNIVPVQISAKAANTFTVRLQTGCGGSYSELYDLYATELADPANFKIVRASTGNEIDITSVAAVPNSKGFLFTMDATDTDYSAGADVILSGSTVSVLAGNDVVGFEIIAKTIVATV